MGKTREQAKPANKSRFPLFGRAVKHARENLSGNNKSLTQHELVTLLGLKKSQQSTVARIERGFVDPSIELLTALSTILGVSTNYLVSLIIQDKYGMTEAAAFTVAAHTLPVDGLVEWVGSATSNLLVVTNRNLNIRSSKFWAAFQGVLKTPKTSITFFVPEEHRASFETQQAWLLNETGREKIAVLVIPLRYEQYALMTDGYIIANDEQRRFLEGYSMLFDLQDELIGAVKLSDHKSDILMHKIPWLENARLEALQKYETS